MYVKPEEDTGIDDKDILTVYIPDLSYYFGTKTPPGGRDLRLKEWDCAAYEIKHFLQLLSHGNPNVLSSLWLKPEMYIYLDDIGRRLVENRNLFATKKSYHSFGGYAHGQMQRMTSYSDLEKRSNCGCVGYLHDPNCAALASTGRGSSKRFATGFMGAKRKGLVEKFGYDTKNAAHLIRLLCLGGEFLKTGNMTVDRRDFGDAEQLLAIKKGKWSLQEVQDYATTLFADLREANESSPLPEGPDEEAVNNLMTDILCEDKMTDVVLRATLVYQRAARRPLGLAGSNDPEPAQP
jgi:hypothetical protein